MEETHNANEKLSTPLLLATTSVYRLEIFKKLGIQFTSEWSNVDEYTADRPSQPEELTQYLAKLKAEAVAKNHHTGIIVGFDSVGFFQGEILEKPKTREEWFQRLQAMSWNIFSFFSGVYMVNMSTGQTVSQSIRTDAKMRKYNDQEIEKYLDNCDERYKTHAHGFDPSNYYSMTFIDTIQGNPLNIMMWIPLSTIMEMLQRIGYNI